VDWRGALSPRVGHIRPNWVNNLLVCLFLFSHYVLLVVLSFSL